MTIEAKLLGVAAALVLVFVVPHVAGALALWLVEP